MDKRDEFVAAVKDRFPPDRLTYQKRIPTFHPESAQEAAALFALANERGQRLFIAGYGNNVLPEGDPFQSLVAVKTDRLNQLIEINSKDLYVKAGGGYPLRELNRHLAEHHLFVPHASLPYVGSVGGALAVGLAGEMHGHEVPLRRYFLKAEIVTPTGEIITPGSVCFKSTSGYDIVKVYAGSWGLLGLIVSAYLRAVPDSALEDYAELRESAIDRDNFLSGLAESSDETDVIYSRKIKSKFDPKGVLPVV